MRQEKERNEREGGDFQELRTRRPGDRVLRRLRKPQNKWHEIFQNISRLFKTAVK